MSQEYQPITQKYLLPMTSYLVELGRVANQWAVRIFRGPTEIGTTRMTTDLNHNEIFNAIAPYKSFSPSPSVEKAPHNSLFQARDCPVKNGNRKTFAFHIERKIFTHHRQTYQADICSR